MKEHDRSWNYNPPYLLSKKESSTNSNLAGSNNVIIIFRDGSGEGVRRAKDKSKGADARLSGNKSKGTSGIIERGAIRRAPPRSLIIEARNRKELLTRGGTIEPALRGTIQRNKWFVVICTQWAPTERRPFRSSAVSERRMGRRRGNRGRGGESAAAAAIFDLLPCSFWWNGASALLRGLRRPFRDVDGSWWNDTVRSSLLPLFTRGKSSRGGRMKRFEIGWLDIYIIYIWERDTRNGILLRRMTVQLGNERENFKDRN